MSFLRKIVRGSDLESWRNQADFKRPLVVTNGVFDLFHIGHALFLETARNLGASLLVGITGDASARLLKGAGRPVNSESERAALVAALESVEAVCIFPDLDARSFLLKAKPDLYVKGGDYKIDTINQSERHLLESLGVPIQILPHFPGKSSSEVIAKILNGANPNLSQPGASPGQKATRTEAR